MPSIKELIIKANEKNLLRYPPEDLEETMAEQIIVSLDLRRTFGSGVEFGYHVVGDRILFATQTIDGNDLELDEFVAELAGAVGEDPTEYVEHQSESIVDEQPCQHQSQTPSPEREWIVTEKTSVMAKSEADAIDRVVYGIGNQEVISQDAEEVTA